jgi:hypothetical protein
MPCECITGKLRIQLEKRENETLFVYELPESAQRLGVGLFADIC